MKLTTQEEYGLRCLLRLGREGAGQSLTIAELSRQEGISAPNVAKMMGILRRAERRGKRLPVQLEAVLTEVAAEAKTIRIS